MGFTIDPKKSIEENMGSEKAAASDLGLQVVGQGAAVTAGRRRSKRGGVFGYKGGEDSDDDGASTVSSASSVELPEEVEKMIETTAKATILSSVVKYFRDHQELVNAAGYTLLAGTVLFAADKYYSPEVCSNQWQKAVEAMTLVGISSPGDKCALAKRAYDAGMGAAMASAGLLITAAVQTATPSIDVSDGVFNGVKDAIRKKLFGSAARQVKGKKGGRTKRRGSKKGRKGGKSRKSRR